MWAIIGTLIKIIIDNFNYFNYIKPTFDSRNNDIDRLISEIPQNDNTALKLSQFQFERQFLTQMPKKLKILTHLLIFIIEF